MAESGVLFVFLWGLSIILVDNKLSISLVLISAIEPHAAKVQICELKWTSNQPLHGFKMVMRF